MHDKQAIQMMQRCMSEIKMLRSQIDTLRPRAEAYDNLAIVLSLFPQRGSTASDDIVWTLRKEIEKLESKQIDEEGMD